jgi:hypothetical protein
MRVVDRRRYDTEGQVRRLRSGFPLVNETEQRLGAMSLEVAEREFSHANSVKKCQSRGVPRCSTVVLHRQKPAVREMPDSEGLFRHRKSVRIGREYCAAHGIPLTLPPTSVMEALMSLISSSGTVM